MVKDKKKNYNTKTYLDLIIQIETQYKIITKNQKIKKWYFYISEFMKFMFFSISIFLGRIFS